MKMRINSCVSLRGYVDALNSKRIIVSVDKINAFRSVAHHHHKEDKMIITETTTPTEESAVLEAPEDATEETEAADETPLADNAHFQALVADWKDGVTYSEGTARAIGMWRRSVELGESEVDISDIVFENALPDFVATLRDAGLETFVITCGSTGLLKQLHILDGLGCAIEGPVMVKRVSPWNEETVPGLRVRVA